jgi:hypothetical protein
LIVAPVKAHRCSGIVELFRKIQRHRFVIPVKAGIQRFARRGKTLDPGFRRDDVSVALNFREAAL